MDEAEKYKQRLEAIAEKRRQQDEQDRARREMEDEKLRLQQLKRKSLRDQWLMEGAPLSPSSPDTEKHSSLLWGSPTQEMDNHNDKLKSESQPMAEEKKKEQIEDGQEETEKLAEDGVEMVQDAAVHNGESHALALDVTENEATRNKEMEETEVTLINGGGGLNANYNASEQNIKSDTNGSICATEDVVSMKLEPGLNPIVSEEGPVHDQAVNTNKKEEEGGGLVIRAECVIITDEGDDALEEFIPQDDQQEIRQSTESPLPLPNQEAGKEGGEAKEEMIETNPGAETDKNGGTETTSEAQPATGDGDIEGDIKTIINGDGEIKAEGQDTQSNDLTSVQLQSLTPPLEGSIVASLPVYCEAHGASLTLQAETEAPEFPEEAELAVKDQDPAILHSQFQEVPLTDSQEKQNTEAGPGEQEPLLSQAKFPNTEAEPAAAPNTKANTETLSPTRGSGERGSDPTKCKCCSVM
ncbi:paralemmin-3 [Echeneis naucrates]|uniref:paralemmin-3 n=1 Tax=Echeneis naucrates TaxID=173247 RepID=UPI001113F914|nr:paralemmin-2-like [Echeneis naucrates]XP_029356923.1 paralemmin-2-like [Echeneis naucrates]